MQRIMSINQLFHAFNRYNHISEVKFGGNMYEYKFSDGEAIDPAEQLKEKIKNIDDKYKVDLDYDVTADDIKLQLERFEYQKPTQEQLQQEAKDSLESFKDTEKKDIEQDFLEGNKKLDEQQESIIEDNKSTIKGLEEGLESSKENSKNNLLRRGLARSSIMTGKMNQIDQVYNNAIADENEKLSKSLEKINLEKQILEAQKQSALESFDIAYAQKLTEKINKLTQSAKQTEEAVIKYNNSLLEKEKKFEASQIDQNMDQENAIRKQNQFVLDYIAEYGKVGLEWLISKEKLDAAKESIKGLSQAQAIAQIEKSGYEELLGEEVYKSLLAYVKTLK